MYCTALPLTCQLHGAYDSLRSSFSSFWKQKFSPSTQRRADTKATTDPLQQPGAPCDEPSAAVAITPTAATSPEGEADPRVDAVGALDAGSVPGKAGAGAAESAQPGAGLGDIGHAGLAVTDGLGQISREVQDDGDSADEESDGATALDSELIPGTGLSAGAESVAVEPGAEPAPVGAAAAAEPAAAEPVFVAHEAGPVVESP